MRARHRLRSLVVAAGLGLPLVAAGSDDAVPGITATTEHQDDDGLLGLGERLLHAGPVAGPFVVLSVAMLVANRRADRLRDGGRPAN